MYQHVITRPFVISQDGSPPTISDGQRRSRVNQADVDAYEMQRLSGSSDRQLS